MNLSTPTTLTLEKIPSGVQGIRATLLKMRLLTREGKKSLPIRMKAVDIVKNLREKDNMGEVKAVHAWVRDNIRYIKDVNGVELLHTPEKMLEIRQGDCDDKSMLLAALCESIGYPTRFVAISVTPSKYCHVFAEVKLGSNWLGAETTENVQLGWQPKAYEKLIIHNK